MASQNKSPWDKRNELRNEFNDILAGLLSQRIDPPQHHTDAPQHILLLPGAYPAHPYINSLTNQRWINSYE